MADDESLHNYYADPDNREPGGPGRRRTSTGKPLSTHVPVRFRAEVIAEVKVLAQDDNKTVSSWIRDVVESEVERRRPRYPESHGIAGFATFSFTGPGSASPTTATAGKRLLPCP